MARTDVSVIERVGVLTLYIGHDGPWALRHSAPSEIEAALPVNDLVLPEPIFEHRQSASRRTA